MASLVIRHGDQLLFQKFIQRLMMFFQQLQDSVLLPVELPGVCAP